jgi:hypothetical protein
MKHVLLILLLMTAAATVAHAEIGDHPKASATEPMPISTEPFAEFVSPEDSLPRLRFFADGQVSINDRCPVRKVKLNPRMGASYVNGRPVGFC